jgi:multidrug efflux pump
MTIAAPFIHRPIATSLLAITLLLCGILGFRNLPVSSLPQVEFPTIQITTQYPGANPVTIASLITAPLERQFGQIPSLEDMSSQSSFGLSQITLQFELGRDIDAAAQDVQSAINAASSSLPRGLPYPPVYAKVNPADIPIITIALTSSTHSLRDVSDYADTLLMPRLSEISGVGRVSVEGGVRPAVRVQMDLARLAAYKIGPEDIRTAINSANVAAPKGSLDGTKQSYTLAANDQLAAAQAYGAMVVATRNGANIYLRDVANIQDGLENNRLSATYQDQTAVIIDIRKQPGANTIDTTDRLIQAVPRFQRLLPSDIKLTIVQDRTQSIRASIHDVEFTLIISTILVVLVVLVFLRSMRTTFIASISLPLSLIGTFSIMWISHFSLDNLSLMALTIGTGFIIDDAIVMIENIMRHIENGETPYEAALRVISLTCSLIAVFIPLLFMSGLVGRMFREFALTLCISVLVSAVISLTLTPMMCAALLKSPTRKIKTDFDDIWEKPLGYMTNFYYWSLARALQHPRLMLGLTGGALVLSLCLYIFIPKGFIPLQDTGLVNVTLEAAPDSSFTHMVEMRDQLINRLIKEPSIAHNVAVLGIGSSNVTQNTAHFSLTLVPRAQRNISAYDLAQHIKLFENELIGVRLYAEAAQDIQIATRSSRSHYQYTLSGADPDDVMIWGKKLLGALSAQSHLSNTAAETPDGGLEAFLNIDREKAGVLGVSIQLINDTLNDAFSQRQVSTIYSQSNQYRVILEALPLSNPHINILDQLYVSTSNGTQIPLSNLVTVQQRAAPLIVAHQQQFPAFTISFDLTENASLGDGVNDIIKASTQIGLPDYLTGAFNAEAGEFQSNILSEVWLLLAAIVVIYLILGMLYESYIHPITILSTLPSAGLGALVALILFRFDLSIISIIGILLLMGIVKKNAIMMIDFAITAEREHGLSCYDAIVQACHLRFRPIMMTSFAALLGAIPLAFSHAVGSELRIPLGVSIIGGLLVSQLLTLYTTPIIYIRLDELSRKWHIS